MISFCLNYSLKGLSLNTVTFLGTGVGTSMYELGVEQNSAQKFSFEKYCEIVNNSEKGNPLTYVEYQCL